MFTGELRTKTYHDLEGFLKEDIPEGTRLDYKKNFPKNLEKTIAAMANTEGGLILIGIAEDDDRPRHPVLPPVGVPVEQAVETVISKAYQAIHGPVTPEVEAIQLPDDDSKCVVVVRVQPSARAPHAVGQRTDIYRRVDSQSMPGKGDLEARMELDAVGWLFDRRTRNAEILAAAEQRRSEIMGSPAPADEEFRVGVIVSPVLAHTELLSTAQLETLALRRVTFGLNGFPDLNMRRISGGLVSTHEPRMEYIDISGLTAYTRTFKFDADGLLRPWWFQNSVALLAWAGLAAVKSGRGGTLLAATTVAGVRDHAVEVGGPGFYDDDHRASLQSQISASIRVEADDLGREAPRYALDLMAQILEAFDFRLTVEQLARRFEVNLESAG